MPPSKDAPKADSALQERSGKEEAGAVAESRWPSAGAVVAAMALTVLLPDELSKGPTWLLLLVEGVLLVALIVSGPATLTGRAKHIRILSIALVAVLSQISGNFFVRPEHGRAGSEASRELDDRRGDRGALPYEFVPTKEVSPEETTHPPDGRPDKTR